MIAYGFTLQLARSSVDEAWFDAFTEGLYPHAPDSTLALRNGTAYAGFDREASSLREAVASAIRSVRKADPSVTVVGVVLDDGQPIDELLGLAAT